MNDGTIMPSATTIASPTTTTTTTTTTNTNTNTTTGGEAAMISSQL